MTQVFAAKYAGYGKILDLAQIPDIISGDSPRKFTCTSDQP